MPVLVTFHIAMIKYVCLQTKTQTLQVSSTFLRTKNVRYESVGRVHIQTITVCEGLGTESTASIQATPAVFSAFSSI